MSERESPSASEPSSPRPGLLDRLRNLLGFGAASIRDDIEDALEDAGTTTDFSPQERAMLKNVLNLHDLRVADVMVPRADIISVPIEASLADVLTVFRTAGHSRLPVHAGSLDDPRGMVHIRDFVNHIAALAETASVPRRRRAPSGEGAADAPGGADIARVATNGGIDLTQPLAGAEILRPVLYAPPSMPALDLLVKMQATRTHMALVIDEYGGTDGLASIEDIVEMIVGDIEDEHDEIEAPEITTLADGAFIVDARASLEDVRKALDEDLAEMGEAEEVDTLGGLITAFLGRVPARGEIVAPNERLEIEVLDADPRRVKRLRINRRSAGQASALAKSAENGDKNEP